MVGVPDPDVRHHAGVEWGRVFGLGVVDIDYHFQSIVLAPKLENFLGDLENGKGDLRIRTGGKETYYTVSGGFVEFHRNLAVVLAETAEDKSK